MEKNDNFAKVKVHEIRLYFSLFFFRKALPGFQIGGDIMIDIDLLLSTFCRAKEAHFLLLSISFFIRSLTFNAFYVRPIYLL